MPSELSPSAALFAFCHHSFPASVKVEVTQLCMTLSKPIDCLWNSPGKNTGMGSHSLLQGIFPPQGSNPGLPHCRWILYHQTTKEAFLTSGSFPMSHLFTAGGHSSGASASVLPKNIQGWFPLGLTGFISLQSKGFSRVFPNTTVRKYQFFSSSAFFMVQLSYLYMTTGKTITLILYTSVSKEMSLLFNMLSRFVIAFFYKKQASFNFLAAVTILSDFRAQERKVSLFPFFSPISNPSSDGTRSQDLHFSNVEF